ncbi:hypothetical protein A2W32_01260 [candidate division WWE3 bacterium RBG_16_37_10]|uniref:Uncharacterized protein n=1 Tax=candidate division WWE3 bacterium RBG_16_37_10 TaxID=1802610 RepID=A0A1F4V398_UNCKA|nr:MAG: hypothetical protein A2W32_01260 [candidate division WWE3 bacterium RBG_16_37_10]
MKIDKQKGNILIVSLLIAAGILVFLTASFYQNLNKGNIGNKVETKKEEKLNNDAVSIIGMDISTFLEVNEEPNFKSEVKNGKVIWVYTFPEDESTGYYYYIENDKIVDYKIDEFTGTIDPEGWLNQ